MKQRKHWTDDEIEALRRLYPDMRAEDVARVMGRSVSSIRNAAFGLQLGKSDAFKQSDVSARIRRGIAPGAVRHQFPKGMEPWNKGLKGVNGKSSTTFKPGHKPHTVQAIGTERVNKDGNLVRKVSDTGIRHDDWLSVARIVWEEANGPTPAGRIVVFRHGMKTAVRDEITLERVECISRAENITRNHPRFRNPELGRLVQLKGAINRQVNRIAREAQEQA